MRRTTLLAMLMAAATWVSAETGTGSQRIQTYGRLIATNPSASTVMVERIDGALWVFRVDGNAARELAGLRAGDEVALTFVYDGAGPEDDDVVRDIDLLRNRMRADWPLPFGIVAGTSLRDAGFVRTARGGTLGIGGERLDRAGVDADLTAPGTTGAVDMADGTVGAVNAVGGGGFVGSPNVTRTSSSLLPGLGTPGPVLLGGRNLAATPENGALRGSIISPATTADALVPGTAINSSLARPQTTGNFSPGSMAPNVEDTAVNNATLGGTLARPAAESGFTPGVVAPGVRDAAAGRAGVRVTSPAAENSFTPGTIAPGVRDPAAGRSTGTFSSPGRETLTTGVPANLVLPNNPATNTGSAGVAGGTVGTGVTTTGGVATGVPTTGTTGVSGGGVPTGARAPSDASTGTGAGRTTAPTEAGRTTPQPSGHTTTGTGGRTTGTSGTSGSGSSGVGPSSTGGTTTGGTGGTSAGTSSGSGGN